jgi:arginyl-tRNA synthetase
MIKTRIAEIVKDAVKKAIDSDTLGEVKEFNNDISKNIIIERTRKPEFGDYACNVAFMARYARMAPPKIAEAVINHISDDYKDIFKTEIAAGFINFTLSPIWVGKVIGEIIEQNNQFGKADQGKNKKVLLEYVSANPTGPLHIGHGRWAALGSCIENIMNFLNYRVDTEFYVNDAGSQIKNLGYSLFLRILQQVDDNVYFPLDKETDPRATSFYPGDYLIDQAKIYIKEHPGKAEQFKEQAQLIDNVYLPTDDIVEELSLYAKKLNMNQQKELLKSFKTDFNSWYLESDLHNSGKVDQILDYLWSKEVLYEKDLAIWFESSRFLDTDDRVVRKSDNSLTYLTADIAYHKDKLDRGYDLLINIWGADHHGYVARMKSAVQALGYPADTLEIIIGQMVNLIIGGEPVRMGKRKKMYTLEDLIEEVGVDATRFWMVSRSTDSTLDFDIDLAKSTSDENPVYYVQYAHARCCSILRTATSERLDVENKQSLPPLYSTEQLEIMLDEFKYKPDLLHILWHNNDDKQNQATKMLVLYLETFKDVILKAGRDRAPHYIARYLIDLAGYFHSFYAECRVLNLSETGELSKELQNARLALIHSTRVILKNGLKLLEVNAPESM